MSEFLSDFAGILDLEGVPDELPIRTDQRAYLALLGMAVVVWDDPTAQLPA